MSDILEISLPAGFGPSDHGVLSEVAQLPGSKIIDCSCVANVPMNLCELVVADWQAKSGSVPRLAVVAHVDTWSLLRMLTPPAAAKVKSHGCELRLFYIRQLSAGHVHRWIESGIQPAHELAATLADLDQSWQGTAYATNVIKAMLDVIHEDTTAHARAVYLTVLANIARKFRCPDLAASIAEEARLAESV